MKKEISKGKYLEKVISLIEETLKPHDGIEVFHDKKLKDKDGINRQIDVLVKVKGSQRLGNYYIVVETKNWNKKVEVGVVGSFLNLMDSLNVTKGIIVSKKGFQSGAIKKANGASEKVLLYKLEETEDKEIKEWSEKGFHEISYGVIWEKGYSIQLDIEGRNNWGFKELDKKGFIEINGHRIKFSEFLADRTEENLPLAILPNMKRVIKEEGLKGLPELVKIQMNLDMSDGFKVFLNEESATLNSINISIYMWINVIEAFNLTKDKYGKIGKKPDAQVITAEFDGYRFVQINTNNDSRKQFIIPKDSTKEIVEMKYLDKIDGST